MLIKGIVLLLNVRLIQIFGNSYMILIVDAYNILKNISKTSLISEKQRTAFITLLSQYGTKKKHQIYIVFDGEPQKNHDSARDNIHIIYSGHSQSADQVIIKLIERINYKDNMLVITSDRNLKKNSHAHSIATLDSLEFYHFVIRELSQKLHIIKTHKHLAHKYTDHQSTFDIDQLMESSGTYYKKEDHDFKQVHEKAHTPSQKEKKINKIIKKL